MEKKVTDFINGKVTFDNESTGDFWINEPNGGIQMLAEMRGWGRIQNMFKQKGGEIDFTASRIFQDKVAQFIADAINEKIERDSKTNEQ